MENTKVDVKVKQLMESQDVRKVPGPDGIKLDNETMQ